jgi:hypothetical protein
MIKTALDKFFTSQSSQRARVSPSCPIHEIYHRALKASEQPFLSSQLRRRKFSHLLIIGSTIAIGATAKKSILFADTKEILAEKGTFTYPDGSKYEGDFVNGKRDGKGTYTYANGSTYQGEFSDNKYNGQGTYTGANGNQYVGAFLNGNYHGKGAYLYANGNQYIGDFINGNYHGEGTYSYADGGQYVGDFVNDKRHGQGTFIYPDGSKYKGSFLNDKRNGTGIYTYVDGSQYVGDFVNDKRHGKGMITYPSGITIRGMFFELLYDPDLIPSNALTFSIPNNMNPLLVLETTPDGDYTNVFSNTLASRKIFIERLTKTKNPIVEVSIGSKEELLKYSSEHTIGLLWIRAHGSQNSMRLGKDSTTFPFLKTLLDKLDKDAIVVLQSCNTGKEDSFSQTPSIAQKISNYLCTSGGNPIVIAPSETTDFFSFQQTGKDQFYIAMHQNGKEVTRLIKCPSK